MGLRVTPEEESEGLDNATVEKLLDTHLVRAEKRAGATWYELAHDRLLVGTHEGFWIYDLVAETGGVPDAPRYAQAIAPGNGPFSAWACPDRLE